MEKLPQDRCPAPAPFEFDLQLWLGPVLVPSVAIERATRPAESYGKDVPDDAPSANDDPNRPAKTGLFATWRERVRYRQELARLMTGCPHMIADIGLTYAAAEAEIARPFWRSSPKRGYGVTTIGDRDGASATTAKSRALAG
jgi:uncharacterized protein YjiS (DUF1127 family)